MLFPKGLHKKTGWVVILAFLYVLTGLPLLHPFIHRHLEKHRPGGGPHGLDSGLAHDRQPADEGPGHPDCLVCPFSQHFHINQQSIPWIHDRGQYHSVLNLPPDIFVVMPMEHAALFPRPPPVFV